MQTLRECPFCGKSEVEIETVNGTPLFTVGCQQCGAQGTTASSPELAAEWWNTRPTPADLEKWEALERVAKAAQRVLDMSRTYSQPPMRRVTGHVIPVREHADLYAACKILAALNAGKEQGNA